MRSPVYWLLVGGLISLSLADPASSQTRRERDVERTIEAGIAAFSDQLYDAAVRFFEQAARRTRSDEQRLEAELWTLRALYQLGRYEDMDALLEDDDAVLSDSGHSHLHRFWRAHADYGRGDYESVLVILAQIDSSALTVRDAGQRLRMFGRAYAGLAQHESAIASFRQFDRHYPGAAETPDNLLDWASSLIDLDRETEAESVLDRLITDHADSAPAQTARLWRAYLHVHEGEYTEAEVLLEDLTAREPRPSNSAAEAAYLLARIEEARGHMDAALSALETGQAAALDRATRYRGVILQARLFVRQQDWEEGLRLLKQAVAAMPGHPIAAKAQLVIGEVLLDQDRHQEALVAYTDYLEAFEDPAGRSKAWLGRAWSLLGLRRPLEAAAAFEKAYQLSPGAIQREQALFKVADAYFASQQYGRAREEYLLLTQVFPGSDLIPMALFQAAESLARQRRVAEAVQEFRSLEDAFSDSHFAEQAAMRVAGLHEELGEWDRAITAYNRLMRGYPESEKLADAMHRRGMIRYRLGLFEEALSDFVAVVEQYPDHRSAEQAYYMRGWCLYLLGQNQEALDVSEAFIQRHPKSRWVPDVQYWLAAYHYNQGMYEEAESRFADIYAADPEGVFADESLYWAGRSAMAREQYLAAMDYFNQLVGRYPDSPTLPEVRFAQGDTLSQLGEFAGAILAFEEIIRRYPDHALVDLAWGRKGDCQFTLGNDNMQRYREALNSYRVVLESETASALIQLQAQYKSGRSLEKLGDREAALDHYLQVVYDYVNHRPLRSQEGTLWFTRAAFMAAGLKEASGDVAGAIRILQRVVDSNVAAAPDALHRIERLQQAVADG